VLSAEPSAIPLQGKQADHYRPGACRPGTAASHVQARHVPITQFDI
jgi:hypothetical protein